MQLAFKRGVINFLFIALVKEKNNRMKVIFINTAYNKASSRINSYCKYTSCEILTRISHNFDMEKMSWK